MSLLNQIMNTQLFRSCTIMLMLSAWSAPLWAEDIKTITIISGQTKVLKYPNVSRASIGQGDIANVRRVSQNEVLVTGLKQGITDLRLWDYRDKEIRYILRVERSWQELQELTSKVLQAVEGISVREDQGVIFIEGRALRIQDMKIVEDLEKQMKDAVSSGKVVFRVAAPEVELKAMVMIDVKVIEVRRNNLKDLGIQWQNVTAGPLYEVFGEFTGAGNFEVAGSYLGLGRLAGAAGNAENFTKLTSSINLMLQKGSARLLAEPKLVTRNGSKAEFHAGGEIAIPVVTEDRTSVLFKPYGVILNIEPYSDPDGYIAANIEVEISDIDLAREAEAFPSFLVRKTSSEVNMRSNQTLVISGMLEGQDSKSVSKLPGLGSIPILGELFKNRTFSTDITEIVVFVTPHLIDIESKENTDMLDYAKELITTTDEDLKYSIFD